MSETDSKIKELEENLAIASSTIENTALPDTFTPACVCPPDGPKGTEGEHGECLPVEVRPAERQIILSAEKTEEDFEYARNSLYDIIDKGKEALVDIMALGKSSQHPRFYEMISELIRSISESNSQLIEMHKKLQDIKKDNIVINNESNQVTNNQVFVGSTAELFALMKGKK
jgi:uncharacterized coiled-coil protein SlyX